MKEYWEDEKRTSEALIVESENGVERVWLRSGDEAMVDSEGYVKITGRIKDIIIRGGENIYPPEIENVLLQHPLVGNASVVGLPDERYGEIIAAFVVMKEVVIVEKDRLLVSGKKEIEGIMGENGTSLRMLRKDEVQQWVRERLSKMMVPKHVFWVERMPLTASGKIEKYKLQDLGIRMLEKELEHRKS